MRWSLDATSTRGQQYWHAQVRWGRCNVRDLEGLAASVVPLAILLGVLLVVAFDIFCLLHLGKADTAHFLPKFVWAVLIVCISPLGASFTCSRNACRSDHRSRPRSQ
jgi:hypothetical protein